METYKLSNEAKADLERIIEGEMVEIMNIIGRQDVQEWLESWGEHEKNS